MSLACERRRGRAQNSRKRGRDVEDRRGKRVYEAPDPDDVRRIMVDRLWAREVSKEKAQVDRWAKEIAPSHNLRKRFHGHPGATEQLSRRHDRSTLTP